jgi:hypothetical protein
MASRRPRASTYIAGRLQDLTRMRSTPTAACCAPELSSNVRFCNSRRSPPKSLSRRSEPVAEINVAQPLCHKVLRPFSPTLLYGDHHRSIGSAKNRLDGRSLPHQGVGRRLQPRAPYRQGVQLTRPYARVVTQRLGDGTPRFVRVSARLRFQGRCAGLQRPHLLVELGDAPCTGRLGQPSGLEGPQVPINVQAGRWDRHPTGLRRDIGADPWCVGRWWCELGAGRPYLARRVKAEAERRTSAYAARQRSNPGR